MKKLVLLLVFASPVLAQDRWAAGDLHEHVRPPDLPGEVSATYTSCLTMAKEGGLEWLVFTPHLRDDWWRDEAQARRAVAGLAELGARTRATTGLCGIPGIEDTRHAGHVGVAFVDSAVLRAIVEPSTRELSRGAFLSKLVARGARLTINHPYAGGNRKAKLAEFASDISWKAWTKDEATDDSRAIEEAASCVEVYNAGLTFAEAALGTKEKDRLIWKSFARIDRLSLETGKRYAPVGGSDNHAFWLLPTTWVRVPSRAGGDGKPLPPTVAEVKEALEKGRVCTGGPEAGSLQARVAGGSWKAIGDDLEVSGAAVEVHFEGQGELFLDGRSLGTFRGSAQLVPAKGSRHHLRLVRESSCSGYIFMDWNQPAAREKRFR